jgi:hypothetical protein
VPGPEFKPQYHKKKKKKKPNPHQYIAESTHRREKGDMGKTWSSYSCNNSKLFGNIDNKLPFYFSLIYIRHEQSYCERKFNFVG